MTEIYFAWWGGDTEPAFYVKADSYEEAMTKIIKYRPGFEQDVEDESVILAELNELVKELVE